MAVPEIRKLVERHFRVYEARDEKVGGEVAARIFFVMFPHAEFDARFAALRAELRELDAELVAFLRRDHGEDVLYVGRRPPPPKRNTALAVTLLLLTFVTTTLAGIGFWHGYEYGDAPLTGSMYLDPHHLLMGALTFSLPILLVLGLHELAHFVAARRHGLRPTLPWFIPFPPGLLPIGTLGAFIQIKDDMPDRKALFDVGASGPLAGFIVAIPLLLLGAHLTVANHHVLPDDRRPDLAADIPVDLEKVDTNKQALHVRNATAGSWSFLVTAPANATGTWDYTAHADVTLRDGNTTTADMTGSLAPGHSERRLLVLPNGTTDATVTFSWDDHLLKFGSSALIDGVQVNGKTVVPGLVSTLFPDLDVYVVHPLFFAGWVGLLVTGFNLLPLGQLDGGHVARALLRDWMTYLAYGVIGALLLVSLVTNVWSWSILLLFVAFMGLRHPPPLNERTPLGRARTVLGLVVLLVFLLTFVPVPLQ